MPDVLESIAAAVPALRRYAFALVRNRQDADDIVQDTLLRALDKLHTRREDGNVRAWLFTIMHSLFVSALRRGRRRGGAEPITAEAEAVGVPATQEESLHLRDLASALAQLPIEQRAVILLVGVEDLSYAEAAQALGIPVGTVMSRLARGRERLRLLAQPSSDALPGLRRVK